MFKKINKKGFTLAELLIVVAIIGVLVAISIPIFTAQLKKAHLATNQANARAAYAAVVAKLLEEEKTEGCATYTVATASLSATSASNPLTITAPPQNWKFEGEQGTGELTDSAFGTTTFKTWTVNIDNTGAITYGHE